MKHEAEEKLQNQVEYGVGKKLLNLAREINSNRFPVLMKNGGWSF